MTRKLIQLLLPILYFTAIWAEAEASRPNVLFISVDNLNDWVIPLGGHPQCKTPNIDRLAEIGVTFTRAYCAAPLCNPSREALFSGLRPSTTGVYANDNHNGRELIGEDVTHMQVLFQRQGYYTMGGGKLYHYHHRGGWNEYLKRQSDVGPEKGDPDVYSYPLDFGPLDVSDEEMSDMKIAAWAEQKLAEHYNNPFFMGVGFFRPHMPWWVPRKYFDMHPLEQVQIAEVKEDDLSDLPPIGRVFANPGIGFGLNQPKGGDHAEIVKLGLMQRATQAYPASSSFADACVGRVLDALENSKYAENTIIVLWGDHGWHLGEKLHWR